MFNGLVGCTKKQPTEIALDDIRRMSGVTEMSLPENGSRISAIKAALRTNDGLEQIFTTFRETDDATFRERLIYLCWELTLEVDLEKRGKLSHFFQDVLANNANKRLRNWAAAGLVRCAKTGMEDIFIQLLESDEPSMWRHGVGGLLQIGSESAVTTLTTEVRKRRADMKFLAAAGSVVSAQSQRLSNTVLTELGEAGLTNITQTGAELKK